VRRRLAFSRNGSSRFSFEVEGEALRSLTIIA
jgi:hypothetical protein